MKRYIKPITEVVGIVPAPILSASNDDVYVGGNGETIDGTGGQLTDKHRNEWENIWKDM